MWEFPGLSQEAERFPVQAGHFSLKAAGKIALYNARENETNLKVISSIMGHKDIQITMDIYPANKGLLFLRKKITM